VGTRIPRCERCNVQVLFNGCVACGHLFLSGWNSLPLWDPKAKVELDTNERYLRSVRLLAGQVRDQAALLAHEQAALSEARGSPGAGAPAGVPTLDFGEAPPAPRLNRPPKVQQTYPSLSS